MPIRDKKQVVGRLPELARCLEVRSRGLGREGETLPSWKAVAVTNTALTYSARATRVGKAPWDGV